MATDYVDVPDPNLDHPYVARSTDIKRLRENIRYLKEHTDILEDATNLRAQSHFNRGHGYAGNDILTSAGGATLSHYDGAFYLSINNGSIKNSVEVGARTTLDHYIKLNSVPSIVIAEIGFLFDMMTKPLTFEARCRMVSNANSVTVGFAKWPASLTPFNASPNDGIYLQQDGGGQMRFRASDNGATTDGASFARPANNVWFKVRIVFTDDPVDKALCYVDFEDTNGFIEEADLQTNIPTGARIHGYIEHNAGSAMDIDYILAAGSASLADTA
jgi:hypothetical protein